MTDGPALTILVADDDPASRQLLTTCLEQAGFRTIETDSGTDAVRLAIERQPDLALLDIMMPGMRGTEAAAIIRRETDIPIMILSARDEDEVVRTAVEEGALGYLVKPLNLPQLVPSVRAALARADELRRLRTAESNLAAALAVGRETSVAVGILMERHRLTQEAAFEAIRREARSQRRKVSEVAERVLAAAEALNAIVAPKTPKG